MDLKINATLHLKPADIEEILREFVQKQTGKQVLSVKFNVHAGSDDRFPYSPAGLTGVDVEVKV
jgi:hypothetical protein